MGDIGGIALSLLNIGVIHERHGDYARAKAHYSESMEHYASIGDQQSSTQCLGNLGGIALEEGDYPRAHECFSAVLKHHQQSNDKHGEATIIMLQGYLAMMEDDLAAAGAHFARAQAMLEGLGSGQRLLDLYSGRAWLAYALGDRKDAWDTTLLLIRRAQEAGVEPAQIEAAELAALLLADRGDRPGAERLWAAANAVRAARSTPRAPSMERWRERHAPRWRELVQGAANSSAEGAPAEALAAALSRLAQEPAPDAG